MLCLSPSSAPSSHLTMICISRNGQTKIIYHFLSRPLGQGISIAQIVDFDVLDVVAVGNVHLTVDGSARWARRGGLGRVGSNRRNVDMLYALPRLELRVDLGGGGSCEETDSS